MNKYEVTITETLERKIEVEAESAEDAQRMVTDGWENGDYILLPDDFSDVNFSTKEIGNQKIKVVLLEPGKIARVAEIGTSLKNLQKIVGGSIEAAYFFDEPVCVVCNDEGKIQGLPINRGVYDKKQKLIDVVFGTAFICDCAGENFGSLTEEQIKKYTKEFKYPERFYFNGNEIIGKKFNPKNIEQER